MGRLNKHNIVPGICGILISYSTGIVQWIIYSNLQTLRKANDNFFVVGVCQLLHLFGGPSNSRWLDPPLHRGARFSERICRCYMLQFLRFTAPVVPRLSATTMANLAARRRACFRAPAPTTQRPSSAICRWNLSVIVWGYTIRISTSVYLNAHTKS